MRKNNNINQKTKPLKRTNNNQNISSKKGDNWIYIFVIISICLTFFVYSNSFKGEFTNWDDNSYVTENANMRVLDAKRVFDIFTKYEMSNYHPFVMLTYNVLYDLYKDNPYPYHLFNLLFHLLNTLLVFVFIYFITDKRKYAAFIGSLLFGIHPLHVESVAWISGTKDVLYAFFYFSGLITYLYYKQGKGNKYIYFTFILFVFSCMSKAMAVTFPVIMILIDLYKDKHFKIKSLLNKIPFLLASLLFGIVAIFAQKSGEAMGKITTENFFQNILIAAHGVWFYIYKMLSPFSLSAFYPYPNIANTGMPLKFWLSPVIVLIIIAIVIYLYKKKNTIVAFGFLFYVINIAQVSQILPVGSAIAADRYFYISSFGLFFIIALYMDKYFKEHKGIIISITAVIVLYFSIIAKERVAIWQTSLLLWENVLEKYPDYPGAAVAYNNCGMAYRRMEQYDKAFANLEIALKLDPTYGLAHKNIGGLYGKLGDYDKSEKHLLKAVKYTPKDAGAYNNLGNVYAIKGNYDAAVKNFLKALELNPRDEGSINNLGNLYAQKKDYDEAIKYYLMSINLNKDYAEAYLNLAALYLEKSDMANAKKYLIIASQKGNQKASQLLNKINNAPAQN
ncbi:MAG: hypothetical protein A2X12_07885 [Bacteroidetes bacterium GWE2_29_8]|nr:MAG: hypothetical protein A2X12_07885 [Bacteroidetes bacterium GWE2_29_8]